MCSCRATTTFSTCRTLPRRFVAWTVTVRLPTADALAVPEIVARPRHRRGSCSPAGSLPLTRVIRGLGLPDARTRKVCARPALKAAPSPDVNVGTGRRP